MALRVLGIALIVLGLLFVSGSVGWVIVAIGGGVIGLAQARRVRDESSSDGVAGPPTLFTGVRFRDATPGFDRGQVDGFLHTLGGRVEALQAQLQAATARAIEVESAARTAGGDVETTALPSTQGTWPAADLLTGIRFAEVDHGYDAVEVTTFLREAGIRIAELQRREQEAQDRIRRAEAVLAAVRTNPDPTPS